jgi:hypothetical protein
MARRERDVLAIASAEWNVREWIARAALRGTESIGVKGLHGLAPVLRIAVHIVR